MKNAFIGINLDNGKQVNYSLNSMTQHVAVLGTTGSGKTVICKVLIEEALANGVPVIAIDPKGDIGGLAQTSRSFDFRPFVSDAEKVQKLYLSNFDNPNYSTLDKLCKTKTKIYTPKSSVGIQVNLLPELKSPEGFKEELEKDPSISAGLIEPLSESICQLAGISGNDKAKSLISSIILYNWSVGRDLTIESLIDQVIIPPFESLGNLNLEDFLSESERKKIASFLNLILSSPSKQAWKSGQKISVKEMFKPGNLSVFDLRHTGGMEDKQYAVEQILQEIYRFLLHKGGTHKLNYILYIDEIAGLFPPAPSNPPVKKSLEVLIRQARAFGLGIILATQSPGDIDYKVLGNIGTRFVGKLRTENDMDKVATSIGVSLNFLKQALNTFKTGDFYYNNSVENKNLKIHARWLYSYHAGPLKENEIKWINNPELKPSISSLLELPKKDLIKKVNKNTISASRSAEKLKKIKVQIAKYSDKTRAFITESVTREYIPVLSVTIKPKPFKNKNFPELGPYIFDLTKKNNLKNNIITANNWKSFKKQVFKIVSPKISIKKSIYYAIKDSQRQLKKSLYTSKVIDKIGENKDSVVNSNYNYIKEELFSTKVNLMEKGKRKQQKLKKLLIANKTKLSLMQNKIRRIKTVRLVRKIFGNKRLNNKTVKIKKIEKIIKKLKKKNESIKLKIRKIRKETQDKIRVYNNKLENKSRSLTKRLSYNPSRKDLIVDANLLLYPVQNIK